MYIIWTWIPFIAITRALAIDASKAPEKPNEQNCERPIPAYGTLEEKSLPSNCYAIPKTGLCRAAIPVYYFDLKYRECKQTIYGGCGGCAPFGTEEECKNSCLSNLPPLSAEKKKKLKEEEEALEKKKQEELKKKKSKEVQKEVTVPEIPENETFKESLRMLEDDLFNAPSQPQQPDSDPFQKLLPEDKAKPDSTKPPALVEDTFNPFENPAGGDKKTIEGKVDKAKPAIARSPVLDKDALNPFENPVIGEKKIIKEKIDKTTNDDIKKPADNNNDNDNVNAPIDNKDNDAINEIEKLINEGEIVGVVMVISKKSKDKPKYR